MSQDGHLPRELVDRALEAWSAPTAVHRAWADLLREEPLRVEVRAFIVRYAGRTSARHVLRRTWRDCVEAFTRHADTLDPESADARALQAEAKALQQAFEPGSSGGVADLPEHVSSAVSESRVQQALESAGHESDVAIRRAIELWAMKLAAAYYYDKGFSVVDTSAKQPFDLRCSKDGKEVRVEVKGTRTEGTAVQVTVAEVENSKGKAWRTDLFVVSRIEVTTSPPVASGGRVRVVQDWRPAEADLEPLVYRHTLKYDS